jgi:hypothetical protein
MMTYYYGVSEALLELVVVVRWKAYEGKSVD